MSHVLLSMDPAQMPFLHELSKFSVQDWAFLPAMQSSVVLEKAAAAVASCLSAATQLSSTASLQSGTKPFASNSDMESAMHTVEATLMQALGSARVKIGATVNAYLNQLGLVTTLCLPNSIPADADSAIDNLRGETFSISYFLC